MHVLLWGVWRYTVKKECMVKFSSSIVNVSSNFNSQSMFFPRFLTKRRVKVYHELYTDLVKLHKGELISFM